MSISEEAFYSLVERKLVPIWSAVLGGCKKYRNMPDITVLRPSTAASVRNDLIFGRLIAELDDFPECRVIEDHKINLRLFAISDDVLLWLKKVNPERHGTNYPTTHNLSMLAGKQIDLLPRAAIVVVGYLLDQDEASVRRLSFAPPCPRNSRPKWFFDIMRRQDVSEMPGRIGLVGGNKKSRLIVIRGDKQIELDM
jgi:hypothetical protein